MRHLMFLTALALSGVTPPPPPIDDAVHTLGRLHRCEWTTEEVITIADEVKAIAVRTPYTVREVTECLGRLLTAIRNQDNPIPDVPALLVALGQVVNMHAAKFRG